MFFGRNQPKNHRKNHTKFHQKSNKKTPSKLAVFFIFQKVILGIISPCKLPKIPSKLGDFVTKKEIFLTLKAPSGVRTCPLLTALCICKNRYSIRAKLLSVFHQALHDLCKAVDHKRLVFRAVFEHSVCLEHKLCHLDLVAT